MPDAPSAPADRLSRPMNAKAGTVLFRPGQPCPGFVRVRAGAIRVSITSAQGRELVLYRVRPGDICLQTFSCLIEHRTYSAEGVAEADLEADLLPPSALNAAMETDAAFRSQVMEAVARRFSDFERLVQSVALSGVEARLARALLALAGADGAVAATHEALAAEAGSARAVVSRTLGQFSERGLVALSRGQVMLLDRARLSQIAGDPS